MNMNSNGYLNFLSINSVPDAARSLKPESQARTDCSSWIASQNAKQKSSGSSTCLPQHPHEPCGVISRDKTLRLFIIPATRGS